MGVCRLCEKSGPQVSDILGYCADCIRKGGEETAAHIRRVHVRSRTPYHLPETVPRRPDGVSCPLCMHGCAIPEGERGYCGVRRVRDGRLIGGRPHEGNVFAYHDPLPTNCVADFVCAGGTGCGYPKYAVREGPEHGYRNLAVFYHSCSFNCLYCQNAEFKERTITGPVLHARDLAGKVDPHTTCICFFGGDPTSQVLHAVKTAKLAALGKKGEVLRICWETNGCAQQPYMEAMADLSLQSGGCVKIDLKAWSDAIHQALCGTTKERTLENFRYVARLGAKRPEPPLLIASTLLVPGYVDEDEVYEIAKFIAEIDPAIPYKLLAFYPHFYLPDLPTTSRNHAGTCLAAARSTGLERVELGNVNLLGGSY